MAEFDDAFGTGAGSATDASPPPMVEDTAGGAEVDPAAEFLAKEQEDLGGLGEDLGFTSAPQDTLASQNGDMNFDFLADAEPQQGADVLAASGVEKTASLDILDNGDVSDGLANPFLQSQVETSAMNGEAPVDNLSNGINNMRVREEPESIKKWKADQEVRLREKDENEEKNKDDLKKQAAKELEDWYKRYEEQLNKNKETNRNDEQTVVQAEVNSIEPGTEWERVAKQCDFSSKNTRNIKDVSRMRGILLQLKQNPPTRD